MDNPRSYSLDDPELDVVMRRMAEETAANWPPLTDAQRARLAPLLAPDAARSSTAPQRRAA